MEGSETMPETITFVGIYAGSIESFQAFLGGAKWISSIHCMEIVTWRYGGLDDVYIGDT